MKGYIARTFRRLLESNSNALCRQHVLHDLAPLYYYHNLGVTNYFGQFLRHNTGLRQAVKVKMMDLEFVGLIYLANGKRRAGDFVAAARTAHQAAHKSRFAAA